MTVSKHVSHCRTTVRSQWSRWRRQEFDHTKTYERPPWSIRLYDFPHNTSTSCRRKAWRRLLFRTKTRNASDDPAKRIHRARNVRRLPVRHVASSSARCVRSGAHLHNRRRHSGRKKRQKCLRRFEACFCVHQAAVVRRARATAANRLRA